MTTPTGEANGNARLTQEQVKEAKAQRAQGATFVDIAAKFGVDESTVRRAVNGTSWREEDRAKAKRLEELQHAKAKLHALAQAMVLVRYDSTAAAILAEVLEPTGDGTGTDVADLHDMVLLAFAHSNARVEVESRVLAGELRP